MSSQTYLQSMMPAFPVRTIAAVVASLFAALPAAQAQLPAGALPSGANVVSGSASFQTGAAALTVQQHSAKLITHWNQFNIGKDAKVEFIQPSAQAMVLNRVTSGSASQIMGLLKANGRVFLVNPSGVLFGSTARVDVGALVASTMDIKDRDFLDGNYQFDLKNPAGKIENFGELISRQGGFVALLGAEVDNAGRIVATGGQAALAAGQTVRMQIGETGLLGMDVSLAQTPTQVSNSGTVIANGGNVLMSAQSAAGLLSGAVNLSGVVQASRIDGQGGNVRLDGGEVTVSASGRIESRGQGTDVTLWSERATQMDGSIQAVDGKVDTSSASSLGVSGQVQARHWVLDPRELIVDQNTTQQDLTPTVNRRVVLASSVENFLNGGAALSADGVTSTVPTSPAPRVLELTASQLVRVDTDISKTLGGAATLVMGTEAGGSAANVVINKPVSSIVGPLNIQFGVSVADSGGLATLNAPLATNGGNVTFFKDARLAHATPISTKITEASSGKSGDIVFYKDALLAAPGYAVSLDTQGPQSGGSYTGRGGNIDFQANILSAEPVSVPQFAQALSLDSTGYDATTPLIGPGEITLGSSTSHVVGGTNRSAAAVNSIRSLTLLGDMEVDLKARQVNIVSSNGNVITAESRLGTPTVKLHAAGLLATEATVINVYGDPAGNLAGNVQGYTDYLQSSFNIAGKNDAAQAQALIINSDRAIKLVDRSITAGDKGLQVTFNPNQSGGSGVGGVVLDNASVATRGQNFTVSNARGNGNDSQLQTDGFYAFNSTVRTLDGALSITAEAPTDEAAGAGIRLVGAQTVLDSRMGALALVGSVTRFAAAGNKDGVVIGEGGNARVTVTSTSGNISITGDASGVGSGDAVTGGDRYNGVVISSKALVETGSGSITIIGKGGGGDKVFIGENHGVRFSDADTSVVSATGNIAIMGQSGGKTTATSGANSFGIYAEGATMYLGSGSAAYETTGANIGLLKAAGPTATGHITLAADSMQFVNTSSSHLKVASKKPSDPNDNGGELRIHTLGVGTDIEIGSTTGQVATSQNKATLYLGNNWFNGSTNAIFQPGFRDVVIGNALGTHVPVSGQTATVGSTGTLTVSAAATFRDNLVLDMSGTDGKVNIPANLTVTRAGSDDRTLTIETQAGAQAAGIVRVDALQLLGSGDQVFTGGNLVNTLATNVDGNVLLNNAQNLQVGTVSVFGGDAALPASHAGKNKWLDLTASDQTGDPTVGITALNRNVTLNVTNGNLDQTAAGAIRSEGLSARATGWVDLFKASANDVDNLAGQASAGDFAWKDADGFKVTQVVNTLGGVVDTLTGVTATGVIDLQALTGDITQDQRLQANALRARAGGSVVLNGRKSPVGGMADDNNVAIVSGVAGQNWAYTDIDNVQVASTGAALSDAATAGVSANATNGTIDLRSVTGGLSQSAAGALRAASLQASAATGVVLDTANNGATPPVSTNDVGVVAGSTAAGDFIYRDANALTVGTAAGVNGITASAGRVSLEAGDALDQSALGVITSPGLRALGTSVALSAATNNVQTLAGSASTGGFAFKNAGALTVGQVQADGTRLSSEGISAHATNGTVDLETLAGALGQTASGGITGKALRAMAPADVLLATADDNNVEEIAGAASDGHFVFKDALGNLNVGEAAGAVGIAASGTTGTVDLQVVAGSLTQTQNITGQALRAQAQGSVTLTRPTNNVDLLAGAATTGNFSYRDADAVTVATVAFAQDATVKTPGIRTDVASATLDLQAATVLDQQAGAPVMARDGLLRGASVNMKERDNQISTLAGSASNGGFAFYGTADLTVGTVGGVSGIDATAPVGTRAEVDVQTRGNLTLRQAVSGQSAGNELLDEAVVLRAEKRFYNETGLGADAIVATGGRWLVYDDNPLLLDKDMNGLAADRNFLLINTRYQDYPPASVYARGNGYITTAQALEPADVARPVSGHQSVAMGNQVRHFSMGQLANLGRINGLIGASPATVSSLSLGDAGSGSVSQQTPLRVSVAAGQPFRIDLRSVVGQGRLSGVTLADGGAAPWVAADGTNTGLIGTAAGAADLAVSIQDPGAAQVRRVRVQLQPR